MTTEVRMVSASGILGYGFPEESLKRGLEREPHMIGVDGGSSDPGPFYLGSGKCLNSRIAMKRDLKLLLNGAMAHRIPMIIGTCGGAGGEPHLQACVELTREIAREDKLKFRMAVIHSEQSKDYVRKKVAEKKVRALGFGEPLDAATVDRAERIVGMMGPEPYLKALDEGAQVILAGRSTDPAPWAALAMRHDMPAAPAWYAGKMLECACNAALPKGHDCLYAAVAKDYVEVEPTNPERKCTPLSVAVQALHENSSPVIHHEPGGMLDTTDCDIRARTDRAVRISNMRWTPEAYTIKLEGVERVGYSTISIAGVRDPGLLAIIDSFLDTVRNNTAMKAAAFGVRREQFRLVLRLYGRDGVMADWEPARSVAHEIGIVLETVAETQEIANAVAGIARAQLLHTDFTGRMCKEGNMAFPFSPSDIERGPVYEFRLRHVVEPAHPLEMFPIEYETV